MLDALLIILLGTVAPENGLLLMINVMKMKAIVTPIGIVLTAFFVEQIIALRDSQKDSTAAQQILLVVIVVLVRINNSIYLKFLKYLLSIFYLIKLKENSE